MNILKQLQTQLQGELHFNNVMRTLYATDASSYSEYPLAVAFPKSTSDIIQLIKFAQNNKLSLIPRAAGTSLAGQVVGNGIVVDIGRFMNQILEINTEQKWVKVQPGVVQDELNQFLKPYGFMFGPNTATATRNMIGGMIGNNSCGSSSIVYGSTRDHLLSVNALLSNGTQVVFKNLSLNEFKNKCIGTSLESTIYRQIAHELSNPKTQTEIRQQFPHPDIHRRNTGYAVDMLLDSQPFALNNNNAPEFNFCKLIAGSEGTLCFVTEATLNIVPLAPPNNVLVCGHFNSITESLTATLKAMELNPYACELMDKVILDCTKQNTEQLRNRYFVQGDPAAILIVEFADNDIEVANQKANQLINNWKNNNLGYAYPLIHQPNIKKVWDLRKAGLGLISNIPGNDKGAEGVEDTAVRIKDLPAYIEEFTQNLNKHGLFSIYYAHAGAGELHLRPILNLKKAEHQQLYRTIILETAQLVKKYGGSLSGEHGDGRLRAEFIPLMIGDKNYQLLKRIKQTWDPNAIFNPNKIVDAPPCNTQLRYEPDQQDRVINTLLDFSDTNGILQLAEKCNGSGDCRKLAHVSGGSMCVSYMATRNEKDTTRARANILRTYLTHSEQSNPFNHPEIYEVLKLCVSCKGCKSECPSNVDMALLKAEFLHQYHQVNGVPLVSKLIANINNINRLAAITPGISNFFTNSSMLKNALGIATQRSMPKLYSTTLFNWFKKYKNSNTNQTTNKGSLYLFCDEFTNYYDVTIGIKAIKLLTKLGYNVLILNSHESGRAAISKGLLSYAKQCANQNVRTFGSIINPSIPLIGIEPSAILSFRDEYWRLVDKDLQDTAKQLAKNCFLFEEFIYLEMQKGNISPQQFTNTPKNILLHGHCHQKALSNVQDAAFALSLPTNYLVTLLPTGCCGMAGSFGYEAQNYELSMQIAELVLLPSLRKASDDTLIAASGTSCRHQIKDGINKTALHPIEILWEAVL